MNAPTLCTALDALVKRYLGKQRALGRGYANEERVFASLRTFLINAGAADLDQELFDGWCKSFSRLTANVRRNRQRIVRNLCLYRRRDEPGCFVPDHYRFPRPHPHAAPVILEPADIARMLEAGKQLRPTPGSPLLPAVVRFALVLLYTAGLRRGELLRLKLGDVDARHGVLRIQESKFHKSRFVPLSKDACRELRSYLKKRVGSGLDDALEAPLLCNCSRGLRGYTGTGLSGSIKKLIDAAQVRGTDGHRPRVHDFRHSFAVQALLRWYRQGADVQSNLPKLAMYMGHVSIVSTAYYLRWMPEIAEAANHRFERRFGHLIAGGVP